MTANVSPKDQKIIAAFNAGMLFVDIGALVNMTPKGIASARRRLGLPARGANNKQKYSTEMVQDVVAMYRAGHPYDDVCDKYDINRNQVAGILNRAGAIKKMKRGKAKLFKAKTNNTNRIITPPTFKKVPFRERLSPAPFLGLDIYQLNSQTCRNPNPKWDDPATQTYCGQPVFGTLPYCEACASINYRPADARIREPRPR